MRIVHVFQGIKAELEIVKRSCESLGHSGIHPSLSLALVLTSMNMWARPRWIQPLVKVMPDLSLIQCQTKAWRHHPRFLQSVWHINDFSLFSLVIALDSRTHRIKESKKSKRMPVLLSEELLNEYDWHTGFYKEIVTVPVWQEFLGTSLVRSLSSFFSLLSFQRDVHKI